MFTPTIPFCFLSLFMHISSHDTSPIFPPRKKIHRQTWRSGIGNFQSLHIFCRLLISLGQHDAEQLSPLQMPLKAWRYQSMSKAVNTKVQVSYWPHQPAEGDFIHTKKYEHLDRFAGLKSAPQYHFVSDWLSTREVQSGRRRSLVSRGHC